MYSIGIGLITYVLLGHLLHRYVFPEPSAISDVYPIVGDTMENRFAKERYIVLKTEKETNGAYAEVELYLEPGGAIPEPHIHPHYDETFTVKQGILTLMIDGVEIKLGPGQSHTVPKGFVHQPFNREGRIFVGIVRVNPPALWALFITQFHGFLTEKQKPRTDLEFFLQAMLVTDFYGDTYLASPPIPVQKVLAFVVAPTARLLGYRSWKKENALKWRQKK
ncbi:cupin domain-containing protein [Leptospira sp. 201903070]|uniref:Cupin domain-containing protein n=1 Tax=Leptospira ainlahdjerensis TaxID=2810033 RepID=A0ABS2UAI6_9LEPT|nr:cupin domain-containing protein [Leptospira ainlahdjerensis]